MSHYDLKLSDFIRGHAEGLEHRGLVTLRWETAVRALVRRRFAGNLLRCGLRHPHGTAPHEVHKTFLVHLDEADGRSLFTDSEDLRIDRELLIVTQRNDHFTRGILSKKRVVCTEDTGQADVEDLYLYDLPIKHNADIKMHGDTLPLSSLLIDHGPSSFI